MSVSREMGLVAVLLLMFADLSEAQAEARTAPTHDDWSFRSEDGECSLSFQDPASSTEFHYTKYADGAYSVQIRSEKLSMEPSAQTPLMLHFGTGSYVVGSTNDPILPIEVDHEKRQVNVLNRFFDDGRPSFFEASVGQGERQVINLAGIDAVRDEFVDCAGEIMESLLGFSRQLPNAPRLIEFTGLDELTTEASRQGMLAQDLGFSLQVSKDGKVTDCKLDRKFRKKIVAVRFCDILIESHKFEPATDSQGQPIEASYRNVIRFQGFIAPD